MNIRIEINPSQLDHRPFAKLFGKSGWGQEEDYAEDSGVWLKGSDNIIVVVALD